MLMARIALYTNSSERPLHNFTLRDTFDSLYADDTAFRHYTTPFSASDGMSGYRDTLLASYDPTQ